MREAEGQGSCSALSPPHPPHPECSWDAGGPKTAWTMMCPEEWEPR